MPTDKGQNVCVGNISQNDGCNPKGFQMKHTLLHMFNYHLPASEVESRDGVNIMRVNSVFVCAPITTSSNIHLATDAASPLLEMQLEERQAGRCIFQDRSPTDVTL